MCELLKKFEALKSMMVLMGSYDLNFLSVDDLEEIELTAEELKVDISDRFEEIDGMYNYDPIGYDIFKLWKEEIEVQYSNTRDEIVKKLSILDQDLIYIRNVLNREKENLYYDPDYAGWCINDMYLVDYFYNNENTVLNPKELEGYMDEIIEDEMKLKR